MSQNNLNASQFVHRAERQKLGARSRRDEEKQLITEMMELLPYPKDALKQLDKVAIMRLTVSYIQLKHHTEQGLFSSRTFFLIIIYSSCFVFKRQTKHINLHLRKQRNKPM